MSTSLDCNLCNQAFEPCDGGCVDCDRNVCPECAGQETTRQGASAAIAHKVFHALNGRKGFDDWWDGIADDVRDEIVAEVETIIEEGMELL